MGRLLLAGAFALTRYKAYPPCAGNQSRGVIAVKKPPALSDDLDIIGYRSPFCPEAEKRATLT